MDLLPLIDENKSHYVYIKDFDRFMFHKTNNKNKKYFYKSYLQCFSSKNVLTEHEQSAKLEKGTIKFKNYFKRILVPYKVYTDFECNLTSTECKYWMLWRFLLKKYQNHIPCSFAYKLVCVDDRFSKPIALYRGENAA